MVSVYFIFSFKNNKLSPVFLVRRSARLVHEEGVSCLALGLVRHLGSRGEPQRVGLEIVDASMGAVSVRVANSCALARRLPYDPPSASNPIRTHCEVDRPSMAVSAHLTAELGNWTSDLVKSDVSQSESPDHLTH